MKKYGLFQYPQKESLSKKVFNEYFRKADINAIYEDIVIEPKDFDNKAEYYLESYEGVNVTVPFKQKVIKFVEPVEDAKEIGAVNCIYHNKGYNTDWKGFYNSLENVEIELPVLIIGAGGACKAILYTLFKKDIKEIILVNRTKEKAENLKKYFSDKLEIHIEPFENLKIVIKKVKTLINSTSIGMFGESFDFTDSDLSNITFIYDIVYNDTPLQQLAKKNNITCLDGKIFWYYQALENLKIWNIYQEDIFKKVFSDFQK